MNSLVSVVQFILPAQLLHPGREVRKVLFYASVLLPVDMAAAPEIYQHPQGKRQRQDENKPNHTGAKMPEKRDFPFIIFHYFLCMLALKLR